MDLYWNAWLQGVFPQLENGGKLYAPEHLTHPQNAGFRRIKPAEYIGQIDDWGISLRNGGRIHIHEFDDESLRAHFDKIDPDRGALPAFAHWATESTSGRICSFVAFGLLVGSLLRR